MRTRTLVLVAVAVFAVLVGGFVYVAVGGGDDTRRAGALTSRTYSGGKVMLSSAGNQLGYLQSSSCGTVGAPVVADAKGGKQLGATRYEPCELEVGLAMEKELYDWITASLAGNAARKSLSLSTVDLNGKEVARIDLKNALLSEVRFPAADAGSQNATSLTLTIDPGSIQSVKPSGVALKSALAPKQKASLTSNFRFELGGSTLAKVSKVEGWSFTVDPQSMAPQLGDLEVTVAESDLRMPELENMMQSSFGPKGAPSETAASLVFLDATLQTPLLTIGFPVVGLSGGQLAPAVSSDNQVARREFTFYVENANISVP
jgi:hypothetical protein